MTKKEMITAIMNVYEANGGTISEQSRKKIEERYPKKSSEYIQRNYEFVVCKKGGQDDKRNAAFAIACLTDVFLKVED